MNTSVARLVTAVVIAAIGIYFGIKLGMYAEADDAPGGVVIAMLLALASLALAGWIAFRQPRKPSANGG